MAEEDVIETTDIPDVDLSSVPEKHREFVDKKLYSEDVEYKRAFDHGYKPKELFESEGGDADLYMSPKKFNKTYDDRQEKKQLKAKVDAVEKNTEAVMQALSKQNEIAVQQAIRDTELRLKQAKEDGDVDTAIALGNELANQKSQVAAPNNIDAPLPVRLLKQENSVINPSHEDYDKILDDVWHETMMREATLMRKLKGGEPLTLPEIKTIAEDSLKMAKMQSRTTTQKPVQKAPVTQKPTQRTVETDPLKKLTPLQKQTYEKIKGNSRFGKEAAERYLKSATSSN